MYKCDSFKLAHTIAKQIGLFFGKSKYNNKYYVGTTKELRTVGVFKIYKPTVSGGELIQK